MQPGKTGVTLDAPIASGRWLRYNVVATIRNNDEGCADRMSHTRWDYAKLMRERGFRVTPQRQLILDAVCEGGGHTIYDEICERVQAKAPAVNRATVYRTLNFLQGLHLIVAAEIGGRTVYEIAGLKPHHHLVCLSCGTTEELSHDLVAPFFDKIKRNRHFAVETNHLALFGQCQRCRAASKPRRAR